MKYTATKTHFVELGAVLSDPDRSMFFCCGFHESLVESIELADPTMVCSLMPEFVLN